MLKSDALLEGRYKIVKILGQGGMGAVYLAEDQRLPTQWAIKEMKRDGLTDEELEHASELFRTEARLLSELRHRNLPRIVDFFETNGKLYLVMDFIEGSTLETKVEQDGPLSTAFALDLSLQISDVLDYLHTRPSPVIFRDFKPANVMLTPQNEVKLVDFGIARIFRQDQASDTRALGTPGYAAPEQYGQGQSGPRTDLYAFGATLHFALSGRDPTPEPFVFPPLQDFRQDLPAELVALIGSCLALKADERPPSAFAMKKELERLAGHTGSSVLGGRPTTTQLSSETTLPPASSTPPGTLPLPTPPATSVPPSDGYSVTFMPNSLLFKDLPVGRKAHARIRVKTSKTINLVCGSPQLKVEPQIVEPGVSTVIVSIDSSGLDATSVYRSAVEVQEVEEADLPVEARLTSPKVSTAVMFGAIGLAVSTLLPFFNYISTLVLMVVILSTPKVQRSNLRIPWRISVFLSLCWTGLFVAVAFGLTQVDWHSLFR